METTRPSEFASAADGQHSPRAVDTLTRIPELDGLRGLAILLVLFYHFVSNSDRGPLGGIVYRIGACFRLGWSGVDLFFILSGFLIGGILLDARESPRYFRAFYLRRVHRILPIYYAWILLFAILALSSSRWLPASLEVPIQSLWLLPAHVLFFQNFLDLSHSNFGWFWLAALWSLAVEEQFYLVAPALVRFLQPRRLVLVLLAAVICAPVLRVFLFHEGLVGASYVWMPSRADSLALGMLAAVGWRSPAAHSWLSHHRRYLWAMLALLFPGLLIMTKWFPGPISLFMASIGFTWLGLFYSGVLLIVLLERESFVARASRWVFLRELGCVSYCMYVMHKAVNAGCHALLLHGPPRVYDLLGLGTTFLAAGLTYGIAKLSWIYFEKPLVRRGHAYEY